ncbi:MAG: hypothetical protein P8J85_10980 [Alphaproteobacteria bacterium]|nr:hypothetical protein [Alphaproteobacteria bacterium]
MKNFICVHEFKSESLQEKYFEAIRYFEDRSVSSIKDGKAHFLMNFNNGTESMRMFCWWEAVDADAIIEKLGEMNVFFETECIEMNNVFDTRTDQS